jgi:asparagine synthase (glutamine-hydrolysing)
MVRTRGHSTYVITYNGELYNTEDIRRELLDRGHRFQSYSDTEVLLTAYIEWGPDCLSRLNGIFAFAVWDEGQRRLFAARDRLGVKPLFYWEGGGNLIFGSEIKAIVAHPSVPRDLDETGVAELLIIGPARTPGHGILRGINEVRAGCYLVHDFAGTRVNRYWSLKSRASEGKVDTEEAAGRVRDLLDDTVRRQLVSDVPVCALLSGGLDSSAVTALTARTFAGEGKEPPRTFSVDYLGNDRNFVANRFQPDADAPWVARMSSYIGTRHTYVTLDTAELVEALVQSMRANDLPGMADVDSSLLLFCREVKKHATVALSGEAADEVFGGYPWYLDPAMLARPGFPWATKTGMRAGLLAPEVAARVRPEQYVADRYAEALSEVPRLDGEEPSDARLREVFYLNITRFMPTLLDRKDRMSMASGLEVRVPFCDHRLVEMVWNMPPAVKFAGGREKGLLRLALRGILPDDVLARRKSPYPKTHSPAYQAATRSWLEQVMEDPAARLGEILDTARLREVIAADGAGFGPSWFGQLMGSAQLFAYLAQLDLWLREYRIRLV